MDLGPTTIFGVFHSTQDDVRAHRVGVAFAIGPRTLVTTSAVAMPSGRGSRILVSALGDLPVDSSSFGVEVTCVWVSPDRDDVALLEPTSSYAGFSPAPVDFDGQWPSDGVVSLVGPQIGSGRHGIVSVIADPLGAVRAVNPQGLVPRASPELGAILAGSPVMASERGVIGMVTRSARDDIEIESVAFSHVSPSTRRRLLEASDPVARDSEQAAVDDPPSWATIWGHDRFGEFAGFEVGGVECRMRWISAGRHALGSPEDEPGRWGGENRVDIDLRGFWLAEFPVTQDLHRAVTGENPSHFVDPRRPVERVSWIDAWKMIRALNERIPGLDARLPYEAEWEAACRAGISDATYAGPMEILGENNAPVLDTIAWYGGNSGVDFDLEEGVDSSGWSNKQFEHERAGTRRVGLKRANPWGLYDMLGNVFEWCIDPQAGDSVQKPVWPEEFADGMSDDRTLDAQKERGDRVLRGGSWGRRAQGCRAAFRGGNRPGNRFDVLGFRLSRGQR